MITSRTLTLNWTAFRFYICCICCLLLYDLMSLIYMLLLAIQILFTNGEKHCEQLDKRYSEETPIPFRKQVGRRRCTANKPMTKCVSKKYKRQGKKTTIATIRKTDQTQPTTTHNQTVGKPDASMVAEINQPSTTQQDLIRNPNDESLPSTSIALEQSVDKPGTDNTNTDATDIPIFDAKSDNPDIAQCHPESETTPQFLLEGELEINVVGEDVGSNHDQHINDLTSFDQVAGKGCAPHLLRSPKCDQVGDKSVSGQHEEEIYSKEVELTDNFNYKRMELVSNKKQRQSVASKKRKKQACLTPERDKKYDEFVRNSYEFLFEVRNANAEYNARVHILYGYVLKTENCQPSRVYMHYEWNRFISFEGYQGNRNTFRMARNGFYHFIMNGISYIICHFCHMILERLDDSDAAHPHCPLFSGNSINIPIHDENRGNNGITGNREATIDIRRKVVELRGRRPTPELLCGPMVDVHNHARTSQPKCRVVQITHLNPGGDLMPPLSNRKCVVCQERDAINERNGHYCCCAECQDACPNC